MRSCLNKQNISIYWTCGYAPTSEVEGWNIRNARTSSALSQFGGQAGRYMGPSFKTEQQQNREGNPSNYVCILLLLLDIIIFSFVFFFLITSLHTFFLNDYAVLVLLIWSLTNFFSSIVFVFWSLVMPQTTAILLAVSYVEVCHNVSLFGMCSFCSSHKFPQSHVPCYTCMVRALRLS